MRYITSEYPPSKQYHDDMFDEEVKIMAFPFKDYLADFRMFNGMRLAEIDEYLSKIIPLFNEIQSWHLQKQREDRRKQWVSPPILSDPEPIVLPSEQGVIVPNPIPVKKKRGKQKRYKLDLDAIYPEKKKGKPKIEELKPVKKDKKREPCVVCNKPIPKGADPRAIMHKECRAEYAREKAKRYYHKKIAEQQKKTK